MRRTYYSELLTLLISFQRKVCCSFWRYEKRARSFRFVCVLFKLPSSLKLKTANETKHLLLFLPDRALVGRIARRIESGKGGRGDNIFALIWRREKYVHSAVLSIKA